VAASKAIEFVLDTAAALAAVDQVPDSVHRGTDAVTAQTATSVATEARARVARRTGATAASIRVRPTKDGYGYVVIAGPPANPMRARYLEFGTRYMYARPFLLVSASLEAPTYRDKVGAAVQAGVDAEGLGPNG
jgi:HK97 gp10 family phage protein